MQWNFSPPPTTAASAASACRRFARHADGACPRPYRVTRECVCDLRRLAGSNSDWPIAILVGAATYGQLLDAGPGLFEPFPDFRSDGNTAASIGSLAFKKSSWRRGAAVITDGTMPREFANPVPPNLVSTVLAGGGLTVGDLKRLLLRAASGRGIAPHIEPLVASSISYRHPELSLGEIAGTFLLYAVFSAIVIGCCLQSANTARTCGVLGASSCARRGGR